MCSWDMMSTMDRPQGRFVFIAARRVPISVWGGRWRFGWGNGLDATVSASVEEEAAVTCIGSDQRIPRQVPALHLTRNVVPPSQYTRCTS